MLDDETLQTLDAFRGQFDAAIERFVCAGVIDRPGFEASRAHLVTLVERLRVQWLVPKDLLSRLASEEGRLSDTASHSDDPAFIREQSAFVGRAFRALLAGESMDDRHPGVPRII